MCIQPGPKKTEAGATSEDQEESTVSTDSYTDSEDSSDDGNITDDEGTTTTTTTTTTTGTLGSSEYSPKDNRRLSSEQLPEASPKQHDVIVEDIPVSNHVMSPNQSGGQVDTLCHNLEEVLPPSSDDQVVDHFENTELDTEQSVLSVLGKKPLSPVLEAENNPTDSYVDIESVTIETGSVEDSDLRNSVSPSDIIINKVIEDILEDKGMVIPEENVDNFPVGRLTHINKETKDTFAMITDKFDMDLQNEEESTGVETEVVAMTEKEKSKLELSDFIEEHYSKEVQN